MPRHRFAHALPPALLPSLFIAALCWAYLSAPLAAFEVRGVIKRVDLERKVLVVAAGGQERTIPLPQDVKVLDAGGQPLVDGLQSKELRDGAVVMLSVQRQGNRPELQEIRLGGGPGPNATTPNAPGPNAAGPNGPGPSASGSSAEVKQQDTSGLTPLVDLGEGKYQGFSGGLYPDGKNARPAEHEAAGLSLAAQVQPLDSQGHPDAGGTIVLLGIGFSNTVQAFKGFMDVSAEDRGLNPRLKLVNGAVGGMSAFRIQNPDDGKSGTQYWRTVDERLAAAGVTREQVQVVWIKETDPAPHDGEFPKYVQLLQSELKRIVQLLPARFPNLKLCYFSSRTYGGWAKHKPNGAAPGNSEPFSYESGFAYKWLIEEQLKGDPDLAFAPSGSAPAKAPWMSWGAYLWANGAKPRSDGVFFELNDFQETDRMHESPAGQRKVGGLLLNFFKTDSTTKGWFLAAG